MEPIKTIKSTCVPLPAENVDTDQIIPARFLKATTREGFGDNLFRDWRYSNNGDPVPGFVLNQPGVKGSILIAGKNFGCGSSREHAAWALYDHGFKVVVSSFFADIFSNNALNNGLLAVQLPEEYIQRLFIALDQNPSLEATVDLPTQQFSMEGIEEPASFEINKHKKSCLLQGFDDIDYLLSHKEQIKSYEATRTTV
ncbi:MAG: 3-isopropylmalate dehydratase small subunit [Cyclobacteriaceae bacterium]|nr:MAG: 3-isopropylmalate dehydratase small subunit [Cyclobacteriaceae bacterium]